MATLEVELHLVNLDLVLIHLHCIEFDFISLGYLVFAFHFLPFRLIIINSPHV